MDINKLCGASVTIQGQNISFISHSPTLPFPFYVVNGNQFVNNPIVKQLFSTSTFVNSANNCPVINQSDELVNS